MTTTFKHKHAATEVQAHSAEIVREYVPFPGDETVAGVTYGFNLSINPTWAREPGLGAGKWGVGLQSPAPNSQPPERFDKGSGGRQNRKSRDQRRRP